MKIPQNSENIQKVSRVIFYFFAFSTFSYVVLSGVAAAVVIPAIVRSGNLWEHVVLRTGTYSLLMLVVTVLGIPKTAFMAAFFHQLSKGNLFGAKTVRYLRAAGIFYLGTSLGAVVFNAIETLYFNAPMAFPGPALTLGVFLLVFAWIFSEGKELQTEQQLTV